MEKYIDLIWSNLPITLTLLALIFLFFNTWIATHGLKKTKTLERFTVCLTISVIFPIGITLVGMHYYNVIFNKKIPEKNENGIFSQT